jgi:chromosome segregation protein
VFDNSDGKIGGNYAAYAEVSLRREVSRDGSSGYFINGARCRRKDITQLFLGTGLGSRSYAIIEQGMISRVIEAKSDEMRAFIEEAAGISKYKERRKETESRIADTRENLERLQASAASGGERAQVPNSQGAGATPHGRAAGAAFARSR